jgi:predicted dehydrogenase
MLRVGLIGAGWVTRHHLLGWRKLAGEAQIVAVADPNPANAAARAAEFGIPRTYASAAEMLQAEKLDAIDIAVPRQRHAEMVRLGAAHSLAILCQKPLCPTYDQAEALVAEMTGQRLMVHENWRFRRYYRDTAQWLREGRIGAVQHCTMTTLYAGLLPDADGALPSITRQPFFKDEPRLLVNEALIHHLDTLRVLMGPLTMKMSRLGRSCPVIAGEDSAFMAMQAESGAAVLLLGNMAAPGFPPRAPDAMTIVGTTGSIVLDGTVLRRIGADPEQREYDLDECYQGSYDAVVAHFTACVRSGAPFETTPEDNLHTLRLVEDAYRLSPWRPD